MSTMHLNGFVSVDAQIMGRMLRSALQYTLAHPDDILAKQTQKIIGDLLVFILEHTLAILIDDIRVRASRHTPGSYVTEADWNGLLKRLKHHSPQKKVTPTRAHMTPELRFFLLYNAVCYAFGDPTLLTSATCRWLREIAPKLHRNERLSIASDIRCYLERDRSNAAMSNDHHWRAALKFLNKVERAEFARVPRKKKF